MMLRRRIPKPGVPAGEYAFIIGSAMHNSIAHAADSGFFDPVAAVLR
jgi:hypothetical protein